MGIPSSINDGHRYHQHPRPKISVIRFEHRSIQSLVHQGIAKSLCHRAGGGPPQVLQRPWPGQLRTPDAVLTANVEYRNDMDDFADFLTYLRQEGDGELTINWGRRPLHGLYKSWANDNDAPELKSHQFKAQMEAHGYKVKGERHTWRSEACPSNDDAELAATFVLDDI